MATEFNRLQQVKRALYSMRNGVVADALRKSGGQRRLIFGVNLPQLTEIASQFGPDESLAQGLWADTALRESQLLAYMVMPLDAVTKEVAHEIVARIETVEEADMASFKLLSRVPFAIDIAKELCAGDKVILRYTGLRVMLRICSKYPQLGKQIAQDELAHPDALVSLADMLAQEADFYL